MALVRASGSDGSSVRRLVGAVALLLVSSACVPGRPVERVPSVLEYRRQLEGLAVAKYFGRVDDEAFLKVSSAATLLEAVGAPQLRPPMLIRCGYILTGEETVLATMSVPQPRECRLEVRVAYEGKQGPALVEIPLEWDECERVKQFTVDSGEIEGLATSGFEELWFAETLAEKRTSVLMILPQFGARSVSRGAQCLRMRSLADSELRRIFLRWSDVAHPQ
jgi:hypothetical protein